MSVSARRRIPRDQRRREYGQNLLANRGVVERLLSRLDLRPGELVVEVGAGAGALTVPLALAGARVVAVERDPAMQRELRQAISRAGVATRVTVQAADLRRVRWPQAPYRVVANPPFGLTTALLSRLLDDPSGGPWRADLLLQIQVARKRAAQPPTSLRSAGWSPWWSFELGERVDRRVFRPVPSVDAAWLTIRRRDPAVLPEWLASTFVEAIRPAWNAGARQPHR
ncbi:MAG: rRNA adenine N(6)-methyltransferase family protein [Actinomycetota bacterium]|nr:methyltransferase domain-containing protein [Euzebyaceae bacterium]MDQ3452611.1 rRNA adenine N(6)-methyltransferase family protein [Actinomycetota bacterium]